MSIIVNNPPQDVIVIGNGFDLNLGFKTSYKDFMESQYFKNLCIRENNTIAQHLRSRQFIQNWIDAEVELSKYSHSLFSSGENSVGMIALIKKQHQALSNALSLYLNDLDYSAYDKKSAAYNLINQIDESCIIINFNYTPSLTNILKDTGKDLLDNKIMHVHGSAIEGKIVFGVSDKAHIHPSHTFLKKGYSPYLSCANFNRALFGVQKITFFGYSLGDMDHTYFKDFFSDLCMTTSYPNTRVCINIHYYGDDGYSQILNQLDILTSQNLTPLRQNHDVEFINVG